MRRNSLHCKPFRFASAKRHAWQAPLNIVLGGVVPKYEPLVFSYRGGDGYLCGADLSDEDLRSISSDTVVLDLEHTHITDTGIRLLKGLQNIRAVDLDSTLVTDDSALTLSTIHTLEEIWIEDTSITDEGFLLLQALPNLRFISIIDTNISKSAINTFSSARPDVELSC